MNNPIPLEYLMSFSQPSQAMMQQLATGLLTSGDNATNFTRCSELASVQQNYLQQMGALWLNNSAFGSSPMQPAKGDRRFASKGMEENPISRVSQAVVPRERPLRERSDRACVPRRQDAGKNAFLRTADPGCAEPVELPLPPIPR